MHGCGCKLVVAHLHNLGRQCWGSSNHWGWGHHLWGSCNHWLLNVLGLCGDYVLWSGCNHILRLCSYDVLGGSGYVAGLNLQQQSGQYKRQGQALGLGQQVVGNHHSSVLQTCVHGENF